MNPWNLQISQPVLWRKLSAYLPFLLVAATLVILAVYADRMNARAAKRDLREAIAGKLDLVRHQLESNINSDAQLVRGLAAAITIEPDISQERFHALAKNLFERSAHLRNIGAAPDLVIRYMYPMEGNQRAIGLDYRKSPEQYGAAERAQESGKLILAGPVNLVQGNQGFIARIPVYVETSPQSKQFWGLVSAVIDVERLYATSGLSSMSGQLEVAIRGKDALGEKGALFYGKPEVFDSDPVTFQVSLPDGSWQIAAMPKGGWSENLPGVGAFRAELAAVLTLILLPMLFMSKYHEKSRESEQWYRALFSASRDANMVLAPPSWRFVSCNAATVALYGAESEKEITSLGPWDVSPRFQPDGQTSAEKAKEAIGKAMWEGSHFFEWQHRRLDGKEFPCTVLLTRVEIGGKLYLQALVRDVSEQKATEKALLESAGKYQRLLDDIGDEFVVYSHKPGGEVTYVSQGVMSVFGVSKREILGRSWANVIDWLPESADKAHVKLEQLASGAIDFIQLNMHYIHPDGDERTIRVAAHPARDENGHIVAIEGIVENITHQVRSEQALVIAREEAERANRAKSEFLSSMSHELRTPMNAVLGFAQLLSFDDELSAQNKVNVQEILTAGNHLLQLINEVLDLAKIEAGRINLDLESVKIDPLVEESLGLMQPQAYKRDIQITRNGLRGAIIRADSIRLKQALINLLSNAIKYNRDSGTVLLDVKLEGEDRLRIEVTDTGHGIAPQHLEEIFKPFHRLDAEKSNIEGTGIGLTITRRIMELMGGSIGVESHLEEGSTFWIELPLIAAPNISRNSATA